jgi:Skp family chaperone for outer membrane proteins
MTRLFLFTAALCLILVSVFAYADDSGKTDVNAQVSVDVTGPESIFVRIGDWFATVGRSKQEKARIMRNRRERRAEKHAEQAERNAERDAWKAEREAQKARQKAEKEALKSERKAVKTNWKRGKGKKKGHEKAKYR